MKEQSFEDEQFKMNAHRDAIVYNTTQ